MKIPPNNQKPVTTNNKPQTSQTVKNVPLNVPFQNTIPISCTTHGDIQSKKFFYEKMARSASNINTDLSRELTKMMESKRGPAGLEGMVVVHNRLQDALNKSINCLLELQKELAGHKPGMYPKDKPNRKRSLKKHNLCTIVDTCFILFWRILLPSIWVIWKWIYLHIFKVKQR